MANKTISDLNELTTVSNSDVLLVESTTETSKVTKENLLKEINEQLNNKSDTTHNHDTVYSKTSHTHSQYLTSVPSEYVTETELNAKEYLTEHQDISMKADKTELHSHSNKTVLDGITSAKVDEWNNKSDFNGDYKSLTNKPTIPTVDVDKSYVDTQLATKADKTAIPTKTSQLTNDSGFLTEHQNISSKADKTYVDNQLATKSNTDHTHSYNDLTDKPTIPSTTNLATKTELTNGLATKSDKVHTHDQYLTEHQDLSDYALKTEIPSVPTKLSQLTNDKGYLTSVPSEYVTETELNNAISGLGGGTGNVSSDVINSIVVVDELPTVEVPGVLYLIKGSGTATEPDTPETPEATNLYYQSEEKTYNSTSSGYNFTWSTDCNILFNSISEMAKEREQSSGDFTLDLVGGKTYKLKATYVSGEMSSSTGNPNYHIYLKDSVTSTKYCEIHLSNGQNAEGTFTASRSETLTAAKMYVYVYTGTLYTNLVYNITLTEV